MASSGIPKRPTTPLKQQGFLQPPPAPPAPRDKQPPPPRKPLTIKSNLLIPADLVRAWGLVGGTKIPFLLWMDGQVVAGPSKPFSLTRRHDGEALQVTYPFHAFRGVNVASWHIGWRMCDAGVVVMMTTSDPTMPKLAIRESLVPLVLLPSIDRGRVPASEAVVVATPQQRSVATQTD